MLLFLYASVIGALVIFATAPATYGAAPRSEEIVFLAALGPLIAVISVGVLRRWRWMFWLLVLAFLAGIIRLPATIVELDGLTPKSGPGWYLVLQATVGALQFVIGVLLIRGYRRSGLWGGF